MDIHNYFIRGNREHAKEIERFFEKMGVEMVDVQREGFFGMSIVILFVGRNDKLYRVSKYDSYNGFPAYEYLTTMLKELPIDEVIKQVEEAEKE